MERLSQLEGDAHANNANEAQRISLKVLLKEGLSEDASELKSGKKQRTRWLAKEFGYSRPAAGPHW